MMVATSAGAGLTWPRRVHQALMPDYNRKAAVYWWTVVCLGTVVLAHSVLHVVSLSPEAWLHVLGGTMLAMLAGLVPVRIPRSTNSFTAGEIFIFLLLLLNGPEAAALASGAEALVGAWRTSKRWTSRIASPAMACVAMFCAGTALHVALGELRSRQLESDSLILLGAVLFALGYFVLNTVMATAVPRLKRNEPLSIRAFVDAFGWLGIAYAGNASVATLLFLSFRQSGIVVVVAATPIIVILLTTGHFFFRREEAAEAVRKAREQQTAQKQLLENARQSGMAEIATNVLHNVGNVLNSVNVSAELIGAKVRASEAAGLARAVALLDAHAQDLGDYLTKDARGRLLPDYLKHLSLALAEERQQVLDELAALTRSVCHIKEIVATQQSYAGASSMVESARITDLIEDALRIDTGGISHLSVERKFEAVPALMLDKHRTLLILVNLIGNARHAMLEAPAGAKQCIVVSVRVVQGDRLQVLIADNGCGIAPENLTRIFAHGFTTKQDGHGFGLHSCVLAAQEMGGTLVAHSDGPGTGATFTLELPLTAALESPA